MGPEAPEKFSKCRFSEYLRGDLCVCVAEAGGGGGGAELSPYRYCVCICQRCPGAGALRDMTAGLHLPQHPSLGAGCKTSQPHPPSLQSRTPRYLLQPAAKRFLAAPHPFPRRVPPTSPSPRDAAWPGGGTVPSRHRPPGPAAGAGDTRPSQPPVLRGVWGVAASQAAAGITQTPLPPLLPGHRGGGGAGKNTQAPTPSPASKI